MLSHRSASHPTLFFICASDTFFPLIVGSAVPNTGSYSFNPSKPLTAGVIAAQGTRYYVLLVASAVVRAQSAVFTVDPCGWMYVIEVISGVMLPCSIKCALRDDSSCGSFGSCSSSDGTCKCSGGYTGAQCTIAPPNPCANRTCLVWSACLQFCVIAWRDNVLCAG